jgi:membrane protein implicated in regulation of membrane protease activity
MKTIKKLILPVFLMVLLPVMASAHPGHSHDGNLWETFVHFVFTYYIFFIIALAFIAGVARYVFVIRSRQKHDLIQRDEDKKS